MKSAKGKKSGSFRQSAILVFILCLISVAAFFIVPSLVIRILFGSLYLDVKGILGFVGLAFSLLAFANLILLYNLSLSKIKRAEGLIAFPIIQILLLFLFHKTVLQFSLALIVSNFLLLLFSLFVLLKK